MVPSSKHQKDRKRHRTSSATYNTAISPTSPPLLSSEVQSHHNPSSDEGDSDAERPCQAERKRELERNRRNLINVRFLELDVELQRCSCDPTSATKSKRIDKEAVLKEATQKLSQQRKDLAASTDRLQTMASEIDNLRAEKVELRADKAYLRTELDTIRSEAQRLRADNIHLWQSLQKMSLLKSQFPSDVAKIPAHFFLPQQSQDKNKNNVSNSNPSEASNALPSANLPLSSAPLAMSQSKIENNSNDRSNCNSANTENNNSGATIQHMQQQPSPILMAATAGAAGLGHLGLGSASPSNHATENSTSTVPSNERNFSEANMNNQMNDTFLIHQSAEEIGELLANYVPGIGAFASSLAQQQSQSPQHVHPQSHSQIHLSSGSIDHRGNTKVRTPAVLSAQTSSQAQSHTQLHLQLRAHLQAQRQEVDVLNNIPCSSSRPTNSAIQPQHTALVSQQPGETVSNERHVLGIGQNNHVNTRTQNNALHVGTDEIRESLTNAPLSEISKTDEDPFSDIAYCV